MKIKSTKLKDIFILLTITAFVSSLLPSLGQGYQQPVEYGESEGFEDPNAGNSYEQVIRGNQQPPAGTTNRPLRGRVVVAPAGSKFSASLVTTLSSGINRVGDVVTATVSTPLAIGSSLVIPSGSQLVGQVVNAIPARRFKAGAGGVLEIRFTALETPDGQRYPLSASIDEAQFRLQAETGGSRLVKGVGKAAVGAGLGAALGTAIGAIAGGMPGRGAWSGAAIGGGTGALTALASKGKELVLQSGTQLPIQLDQSLQVVVPQGNQ